MYRLFKSMLLCGMLFLLWTGTALALDAPNMLTPSNQTDSSITVYWTDITGEDSYYIFRSSDATSFPAQGIQVNADSTSYTDTGLTEGTTYYYYVQAGNGSERSASSATVNSSTPLRAPSSLSRASANDSTIDLAWQNNSGNASNIIVERNGSVIATLPSSSVNYHDDTGLNPGTTYTYRIKATNGSANSAYCYLDVTTTNTTRPNAVSNLVASVATATSVNLTWTDNSTNETGFHIERDNNNGSFTLLYTTTAGQTSFPDSTVTGGNSYSYRIQAFNGNGNSEYSNTVSALTPIAIPPTAPSNLTATVISGSQINLAWTDNSSNETHFYIERKTASGTYSQIGYVSSNITSYNDTGLSPNTTYYYQIRAYNSYGYSSYSSPVNATTSNTTPVAPSNLVATVYSNSRIDLTWIDHSSNETYFYVERKTGSSGTYSQIGYVSSNITSYNDTGVSSGYTYYYQIRAYNSSGYSSYSSPTYATTSSSNTPIAPDDLDATAYSSSRINLTWNDKSSNETYFCIERKTGSSGTYSQINSVSSNVEEYSDTSLSSGTKYYYRVRAYNSSGYSAYCDEDYTTTTSNDAPTAPDGLEASAYSSSRIDLTWDDNSSNETYFYIERKTGSSGSYSQITSVSSNTEKYSDTGLNAGTKYYYRVRAYNSSGYSSYSDEDYTSTTGNSVPSMPSNLSATAANGYIGLIWNDNAGNETNYVIERKIANGSYIELTRLGSNTSTYGDYTANTAGTIYSYRVRAYNISGYSDYSNIATAQPLSLKNELRFTTGKTAYYYKGKPLTMDAAPIIRYNRTMIPIRYVTDLLGATTTWDAKTQKVTIVYKTKKIEVWAGKRTAKVNSVNKYIDADSAQVTPVIVPPGRTMLPLRFVSENLGCQVNWEAATNTAVVTLP